jgi:uncharacterized protein
MTPQESTMLNDLVSKIRQTQLPEKDEEAEQFLKQSLATTPDAQYILAQTVLVQNIALEQAKAQMQQLQERLQEAQSQLQTPPAPAQHTSFLGSLLGRHDAPPPPQQNYAPQGFPPRPGGAPQYYPPAPAYAPDYAAAPPPPPSAGSSFLRSAATTAAGVAAGALAFEGVESLLHGFGHGGGGGFGEGFGGGGGGFGERPAGETVINNYYDDPNQNSGGEERGGREASFDDRGGREAAFDGGDRYANDDRGAQFNDASYDPGSSQDLGSLDDQNSGDLGNSGDFDDGGGFDSGDDSNVV